MVAPALTLSELPLFPLNTVFFPGGLMPLQIFELRYLEMIGRRHREGLPFGIVCLSAGHETLRPAAGPSGDGYAHEAVVAVGTLARIDDLQRPQPGLILIRCVGTQRFRIRHSAQRKNGLWVADAQALPDDPQVAVPDDLLFARDILRGLAEDAGRARPADEAPLLAAPERWNDCGWLANRWSELLPLSLPRKQGLLELDSPLVRLELVADALQQARLPSDR